MKHITLFITALLAFAAIAADVRLAWDPSDDQVKTPELRYRIYAGNQPGVYTEQWDAGTNLTFTVTNRKPGPTWYFAATAWVPDGEGGELESDLSDEVFVKVRPGKPENLVVDLVIQK